jgi:molybdenum cofactor cytidylyltransferase
VTLARWSALVLAAGAARRFGGGKLLAPFAGAPLIRRTLEAVFTGGFAEALVIAGGDAPAIVAACESLPCRIITVPEWPEGMAASLRTGIGALAPQAKGAFVFLGDMPLVPIQTCGELAAMAEAAGYAARPLVGGKPGHPVAFTRAAFADVATLTGDVGANSLLAGRNEGVAYLETDDAGALIDIDAPNDLAAAERAWKARATSATSDSAISRGDLPKPGKPIGA